MMSVLKIQPTAGIYDDILLLTTLLFLVSFRWTALPLPEAQHGAVPFQRYGHTAVCFMDCAYIWGGRNDEDGACNTLYCFDMSKWIIV